MDALFLFPPEAVASVAAGSKADILALLADHLATTYGLNRDVVLEGLEEREKLGSTGFGRGVALPHARIEGLSRPVTALLRLDTPCDFDAADGMPVDLVFGLLSPVNAGATHLHALAAISRLVRDDDTHQRLAEAPDSEALYALITNAVDRDAA
ncbi:PTS sugar transporter subunit IIA [Parerythrobacter aestuarii]|uniref:PTS sugar transporter subunit IIA n=1 Tax=Parerythrobacter aestuarii TaxID=3020909 RepID=UPI0024DE6D0B|nr:PTS sugar transporter subunit IIA [Parerythrobacter aestuarii]